MGLPVRPEAPVSLTALSDAGTRMNPEMFRCLFASYLRSIPITAKIRARFIAVMYE